MADRLRSRFWISRSTRRASLRPYVYGTLPCRGMRRSVRYARHRNHRHPGSYRRASGDLRSCGSERHRAPPSCAISSSAIFTPTWKPWKRCSRSRRAATTMALCCGDLVGYGADPNPVCDWVRTNCPVVVRGNHDRASTGQDDLEWFNPVGRARPPSGHWRASRRRTPNTSARCRADRSPWMRSSSVHGSPFDEDEYVIGAGEAGQAFGYLEARVAFFGHTHVQGGFIWNQSRVETILRMPASRKSSQALEIDPDCAYLINPGLGRPTARRRPARGLRHLRRRGAAPGLPSGGIRRGSGAEEDSRRGPAGDSGRPPRRGPVATTSVREARRSRRNPRL